LADPRASNAARLFAAGAAASVVVLAVGLVLQHGFDKQPCAWCVLQRLVFVAIGVVCVIGALAVRARSAQIAAALVADALAVAGAAAALYQHFVASLSDSCGVSLADKLIVALSLHEIAPWMFFADAPCNQANMPFLGVPFALWSLAGFLFMGAGAMAALLVLLRGTPGGSARA